MTGRRPSRNRRTENVSVDVEDKEPDHVRSQRGANGPWSAAADLRRQQQVLDGLRVLQELDLLHHMDFTFKHHGLVQDARVYRRG